MDCISLNTIKSILSDVPAIERVRNSPELTPYYVASKGYLTQLMLLYRLNISGWNTNVVNIAAENKHYNIVKWYCHSGYNHQITMKTFSILCENNAIDCINYLIGQHIKYNKNILLEFVKKTLKSNYHPVYMIKNGLNNIFKIMFIDRSQQYDPTILVNLSILNYNLDIVNWLFTNKEPVFEPDMIILCIELNCIDIFKYLTRTMINIDQCIFNKAILLERYEIIEYICTRYHHMISHTSTFIDYACFIGNVNIVRLLHKYSKPCSYYGIVGAIKSRNSELVGFAIKNTTPYVMSLALQCATLNNLPYVVRYILNNFSRLNLNPSIRIAHNMGFRDIHVFLLRKKDEY